MAATVDMAVRETAAAGEAMAAPVTILRKIGLTPALGEGAAEGPAVRAEGAATEEPAARVVLEDKAAPEVAEEVGAELMAAASS
jgi:hypothetical protein